MSRCIQLAELGAGAVAPNPLVGAVLVYDDIIIGEGYHQIYGGPHAEVNCINSVLPENRELIEKSTIYVSLEPCAHHGKTPPCADLIIKNRIKKVVVGCKDVYKEVAGKGIQKLQQAGIETIVGVLEAECRNLNKRFFTFHERHRPYIILKWAQSANGKIGSSGNERIFISNDYSNRLVHKWRGAEAAILVGTRTALTDDPSLTNRLWAGKNPVRIVIDKELKLPPALKIFDRQAKTIIFNEVKNYREENIHYIQLDQPGFLEKMLHFLYELSIQSVIVEGGTKTLQSFVDAGLWDEARIITNREMIIKNGIAAPEMKAFTLVQQEQYLSDTVSYFRRQ